MSETSGVYNCMDNAEILTNCHCLLHAHAKLVIVTYTVIFKQIMYMLVRMPSNITEGKTKVKNSSKSMKGILKQPGTGMTDILINHVR